MVLTYRLDIPPVDNPRLVSCRLHVVEAHIAVDHIGGLTWADHHNIAHPPGEIWVAVHPVYRWRGIATSLWEFACQKAAESAGVIPPPFIAQEDWDNAWARTIRRHGMRAL